jgi:hypothetical protein
MIFYSATKLVTFYDKKNSTDGKDGKAGMKKATLPMHHLL